MFQTMIVRWIKRCFGRALRLMNAIPNDQKICSYASVLRMLMLCRTLVFLDALLDEIDLLDWVQ